VRKHLEKFLVADCTAFKHTVDASSASDTLIIIMHNDLVIEHGCAHKRRT
jgi:hypothetical protein